MKIYSKSNPEIYYEYDFENAKFFRYGGFESMDKETLFLVFMAEKNLDGALARTYGELGEVSIISELYAEMRRNQYDREV